MDYTVPALGVLATYLRLLRRTAGVTYEELAARTDYSSAHLKRAASGKSLPTWNAVRAYTHGCLLSSEPGGPELISRVTSLYFWAQEDAKRAAREQRRSTVAPKPQYATTPADISAAMRDAWRRAGKPTTRAIESVSDGHLPRTTANAITNGRTVPRTFRQYLTFLQACEIHGAALGPWFQAWFTVYGKPDIHKAALMLRLPMDANALMAYVSLYSQNEEVKTDLLREAAGPLHDRVAEGWGIEESVGEAAEWLTSPKRGFVGHYLYAAWYEATEQRLQDRWAPGPAYQRRAALPVHTVRPVDPLWFHWAGRDLENSRRLTQTLV
ncbi:helix-turn-helix domain-containing protein [Streptomyces sp. NPDC002962]|uniref:helix-turn-helix domain-containing protein n=1 Tax=Streptomyces sp. NPDC002962 TaxID=3364674 RepID=UPI0036D04FB4